MSDAFPLQLANVVVAKVVVVGPSNDDDYAVVRLLTRVIKMSAKGYRWSTGVFRPSLYLAYFWRSVLVSAETSGSPLPNSRQQKKRNPMQSVGTLLNLF